MAIKRSFILSSGIGVSADNLFVVNNTNSVSSTTGSIVLSGGIGIGQSASISGRLQMFNGANYTSFVSSATGNTVYTLPATSPATGSSVLQSTSAGVLSWVPMTATDGGSGNTAQNIVVNSAGNASAFHPILFTPASLSAGSAVSSDGTISFNPSTEILNVSGLAITSTTASTSTSNGALQVAGGVGISGRLSFNQASFGTTGIATNPTMAMIGQTGDPIFMTVLEDNSIAFEGTQGQLFSITPNLSTGYIYSVNDITGIPLIRANANANVTANEYAGNFGIGLTNPGYKLHVLGAVGFTSTTASTSTTTGTLVVGGGVGIGGSIFGASTISAADNVEIKSGKELRLNNSGNTFYTGIKAGANTSNTTYTFPVAFPGSGTSVLQSDTSGVLAWVPMTASSSSGNTAQNIVVNTAGNANVFHPILFTPSSLSAGSAVSSDGTISFNPSTEILSVSGLAITNTTASTSTSSGALIVTGGVGIGQSVSVGGRLQLFNSSNYTAFVSSASGNTVYTLPATSPATGSSVLQSTSAGVMSWVPMTAGAASGNTAQNIVVNTAGNANVFHPVLFTPSSLSAGSAVSSDSTISFNPSTEILNVSGLAITSGTASTNTTTGALVVRGGLGVTGQLSFAQASFGFTGITTNPTMSFIGATSSSPITLTVLTDNSLSFEGSQGSVFSIDSNLSSGEIFSVSDISGLPIISASAGQTVNINEFGGFTQIGNGSINSSSTTTGSLVVSGGLGLTGNANIGGTVRITNTTASISSTSGALTVSGGVGIGLSASIGGRLLLFNGANYTGLVSSATGNTVYTLPATSPATGTSILQSTSAGVMSWISTAGLGASSGGVLDGSVQYRSGSGFAGTRDFLYDQTYKTLRLGNFPGEELVASTSAALLIEQVIGSFNGSLNGNLIGVNARSSFTGDLINLQTNAVTRFRVGADGGMGVSSLSSSGNVVISSSTNSTSTTTGALVVTGGMGIGGNAFIGGTTTITNTTASVSSSSGALVVAGGVGIGQSVFVGGSISNTNYFYSGGNNFTKSGQAQGDIFLDNNSNDTPGVLYYYKNNTNFGIDAYATGIGSTRLRIVKDLNESGGAELWSIDRTGVVTQTAWAAGEIIKMTVLVGADLTGGSTTTISTSSDTDVASYSYTPVSSNSYLVIDFITRYSVVGAAADDFVSRIAVDGAEQSYNNQVWINGAGGGTRSGTLFPLMARYTNSNTTAKTISVTVRRGTTDDNATVYKDTTTVMKITEIGR
jgi:hypothetical protein